MCFHADVVAVFSLKQTDSHPVIRHSVRGSVRGATSSVAFVFSSSLCSEGFPQHRRSAVTDDSLFKAAGCHRTEVFENVLGYCKVHMSDKPFQV